MKERSIIERCFGMWKMFFFIHQCADWLFLFGLTSADWLLLFGLTSADWLLLGDEERRPAPRRGGRGGGL
jgi:hypothetical protein